MYILGIWDGHDSGAAIVRGGKVVAAVNEERLTRRKLEIKFPKESIKKCIELADINPSEIKHIAVSTYDFSKTLARIFPSTKEEYYQIRRRKKHPGRFTNLKKRTKYKLTEFGCSALTKYLSTKVLNSKFNKLGFEDYSLEFIDHHLCHAAAAAYSSGFENACVITIDGIGDALSGTVSIFNGKQLTRLQEISGKNSLGIFFEHVTNLMNMRELEDEGKVMAIANYAYPIDDSKNPLMSFIEIRGIDVNNRFNSLKMYDELKKILWQYPSEQFAYMAQRTLEVKITELVKNVIKKTGSGNIALSGGVFSNIKVNMLLRNLPEVTGCFVFPHMGDGGLALGAAMQSNYAVNNVTNYSFDDIYFGPSFENDCIEKLLNEYKLEYEKSSDTAKEAARLISEGNIVFWFQGKMEYGPRALGNRSILALCDSQKIRDTLNLRLKMRVWYQPFCPSMLEEDAKDLFSDYDFPNPFMTMGYMAKEDRRRDIEGVISVDGSLRPQIVTDKNSRYFKLLKHLKEFTGKGVVLNTSFNVHGDPMVCSPKDAIETLLKTKNDYLVIEDFIVRGPK